MSTECQNCQSPIDAEDFHCPRCHTYFTEGLIAGLHHQDSKVRKQAAAGFVFVRMNKECARALAQCLSDSCESVRREAALKLFSQCAAHWAIAELAEALDHPDRALRGMAAMALSTAGPKAKKALGKLEQLRRSDDELLCAWVEHAITNISVAETVHVFSGTFQRRERALLYTQPQPEEAASDLDCEQSETSWAIGKDLSLYEGIDVATLFGPGAFSYLVPYLTDDAEAKQLSTKIPRAADTLALIDNLALVETPVHPQSTAKLRYHGAYQWDADEWNRSAGK